MDIFCIPVIYNGFQRIVGAMRVREIAVREYFQPAKGDRILDIGCGTGYVINYLPNCHYVGFDINEIYIKDARKKYGLKGDFHCASLTKEKIKDYGIFDGVMMNGLIHHLNDSDSADMLILAKSALKPGGIIVGIDGCYQEGLGLLGRWMLNNDRGKYVRDQAGYETILLKIFNETYAEICRVCYFFPYNYLIWKCIKNEST